MELIKGLVSVITPAYNSEKYISRLLNSVLAQSYHQIEMIVVDDGSTDKTREIILSFKDRFNHKGYNLRYVYQDNQGQSCAIKTALSYVKGEFLIWPDSDDWYSSEKSIEEMVSVLSNTRDDVGLLRCAYNRIDENNLEVIRTDYPNQGGNINYLFTDVVRRVKEVWIEPGGWMVKTVCFDELIENRDIYTSKYTGQNYQMLLPILYHKKVIAIEKPLFNYLVRKSSWSHGLFKTYEEKIQSRNEVWQTQLVTLKSIKNMSAEEYKYYKNIIDKRMTYQFCAICFIHNKQREYIKNYNKLIFVYRTVYSLNAFAGYLLSFVPFSFNVINSIIKRRIHV